MNIATLEMVAFVVFACLIVVWLVSAWLRSMALEQLIWLDPINPQLVQNNGLRLLHGFRYKRHGIWEEAELIPSGVLLLNRSTENLGTFVVNGKAAVYQTPSSVATAADFGVVCAVNEGFVSVDIQFKRISITDIEPIFKECFND